MKKYLICYWAERNDVSTDLEDIVEANTIKEALNEFLRTHSDRNITSISVIPNFIPRFDYGNSI
jgi:hypothetical protein